jgi:CheY-like chemotaxis protein
MAEILIADDDPDVTKMMAAILRQAGHKVITCDSGVAALKTLGIQPDDATAELPDILILDIMMPKTDGYMAATVIRKNPRTRAIPILVVSALHDLSRLFTATLQVEEFLTKPFTPEDLTGRVAKILKGRKPLA